MARKSKKERKERRKKIFSKAKDLVKKVANAPKEAASFAVTIPFSPIMRSMLQKQGIKPPKKQSELCQVFFDNVIKKGNIESLELLELLENADAPAAPSAGGESGGAGAKDILSKIDFSSIISAIVTFFKSRKEKLAAKKAAGEKLTEGEENTLLHLQTVESAARESITNEVEEGIGEKIVGFVKNPLVLLGLLFLGYKLIKR